MYIKEKIVVTGKDVKIKIPLSSNSNLNGLQESINDYIEKEIGLSINDVTDGETFKLENSLASKIYIFKFYDGVSSYSNTLLNAGFTSGEVIPQSNSLRGSFFITQIFDGKNYENQTLLHSGFLNGFDLVNTTTTYSIPKTKEYSNIFISEDYLNSTTANTITVYARFYFFNAKTGKLQSFYNEDNESLTTENKLYHEIIVNKSTKKYNYVTTSTINNKELINTVYNDKVNTTLDKFNNEKPTYPTGNTFTNSGDYANVGLLPNIGTGITTPSVIYPYYWGTVASLGAIAGQNRPTINNALVNTGIEVVQSSDNTVTVDYNSTSDDYCWLAIPAISNQKTEWFVNVSNNGNISGAVGLFNLFPSPVLVTVTNGTLTNVDFYVYLSNWQTEINTIEFRN